MEANKQKTPAQYKLSLFIAVFTTCLLIVAVFFLRNLNYRSGLKGNAFYLFELIPLIFVVYGTLAVLLIIAIINTICIIIKSLKTKTLDAKKFLLAVTPLLLAVGYLLLNAFTTATGPGAWHFLRGYEKWVAKEVNIPEIRQWLLSLPDEYSGQSYFQAKDFPSQLPEAITSFEPYHIYLSEFKNGQRSVKFEWGCAFGHFGIVIGTPEMDTPKEETLIKHSDSDYEFRRPIEPGVYIFERG